MKRFYLIITILFVGVSALWSQHANVIWNTPSRNSSESMPCGGGDTVSYTHLTLPTTPYV